MVKLIKKSILVALVVVFLCSGGGAFLLFVYTFHAARSIYSENPDALNPIAGPIGSGLFGDAFGFVTALFTGAAFIGLLLTMYLQKSELKATNDALENQRKTNSGILKQARAEQLEHRFYTLLDQVKLKSRNKKLELLKYMGRPQQVIDLIEKLSDPTTPTNFIAQTPVTSGYLAFQETDKSEIFGLVFSSGATEAMLANQTLNELRDLEADGSEFAKHSYVDKLSHLLSDAIPPEIATLYALALARSIVQHNTKEPNFFGLLRDLILQQSDGEEVEREIRGYIELIEDRVGHEP